MSDTFNLSFGHNPYFNRWFSAMELNTKKGYSGRCHNPYFNRWFSAIKNVKMKVLRSALSQSLF